jgi:hypothetical protein
MSSSDNLQEHEAPEVEYDDETIQGEGHHALYHALEHSAVDEDQHILPEAELQSHLDNGLRPEELIAQLLSEEQAQALLALVQHAQQQQEEQEGDSLLHLPQDQDSPSHIQELLEEDEMHHPEDHHLLDHSHQEHHDLELEQHPLEQEHHDDDQASLETEKLTAALQSAVQGLVHESLSSQQVAELESALPQALFQSLALQLCQAALQGSYEEMGSEHEALINLLGQQQQRTTPKDEEDQHHGNSEGHASEMLIEEVHAHLQRSVEAGQEMSLEQLQHTLQVLTSAGTHSLAEHGDGLIGQNDDEMLPSSAEYWTSALNAVGLGVVNPQTGDGHSLNSQTPVPNASDFVIVPPVKTGKDRSRPIGSSKHRPEKRLRTEGSPLDSSHQSFIDQHIGFHSHHLHPSGSSDGGDISLEQISEEVTEEERMLVDEAVSKAKQVLNPETGKNETTYTCPKCTSSFTRVYNLKSHVRSHQNFRPFKCSSCPATFSRNHDLTRHEKIHNMAKPFSCKFCGKTFSRKDALRRHEKMDLQGKKTHCIVPSAMPSKFTPPSGNGAVIHLGDLQGALNIPSVLHQSHPIQQHHSHHHSSTPSPSPSLSSRSLQPPSTPSIQKSSSTHSHHQQDHSPPTPLSPSILSAATSLFTDISPAELEIHVKQLQELKKQMDQLEALESLKRDGLDLTEHMQVLNEGGGELD